MWLKKTFSPKIKRVICSRSKWLQMGLKASLKTTMCFPESNLISTVNHLWTTVRCFLVLFPESNWPKNLRSTHEKTTQRYHRAASSETLGDADGSAPCSSRETTKNAAADHLKCATTGRKEITWTFNIIHCLECFRSQKSQNHPENIDF